MSHVQVGHVLCPGAHFGSYLGTHFCLGPIWVPFGDPFFVWGPFWVPFGDPFALGPIGGPWDQVGGSVRPLEAEGRLFGGPGAEPPGISPILAYVGLLCASTYGRGSSTQPLDRSDVQSVQRQTSNEAAEILSAEFLAFSSA